MSAHDGLAAWFETQRPELRGVAYRMLGSYAEAEDVVQEVWLRFGRVDADTIANPAGWARTVLVRACLDALRARRSRREQPVPDGVEPVAAETGPEEEAVLADAVGRALLVVLDALAPAERAAFVLHDAFALPFDEIAPMLGRTAQATKRLASRARTKVRGRPDGGPAELAEHGAVVSRFLAASRSGDVDAILEVLAPDVVRVADAGAVPSGAARELRGARAVAEGTVVFGRRAGVADVALVDGAVGLVVAPGGRLRLALTFVVEDGRISRYDVVADPQRLARLRITVPPFPPPPASGP